MATTSALSNQYQSFGRGGTVWTGKTPPPDEWYAADLANYAKEKERNAAYDAIDGRYSGNNPSGSPGSGYSSGSGGDWNSGNGNYSYSSGTSGFTPQDYYSLAKDLSAQQLENSKQMMDLSSGYRMREADQNTQNTDFLNRNQSTYDQQSYSSRTTDDMRKADQQYGFQEALDNLKYGHENDMQGAGFKQDKDMAALQAMYADQQKQSNRQAASNLYNTSGKSPFWGGY